ncbi:hypothetical protein CWB96_12205 [Pseudoalteromonas citrea]|uniref:Uncharacterized protein n=1 Tax=Pseudoalteromonas citrea TaxID=43655 RepID=A0A5S3XR61_9GAMM|nr:hypothetical protein [Pseudoalteromonas citrea]TMP42994.1 hypothetical protein CWB97_10200 [Pseudoalteromonas citrea]TMP58443.1 hypothetical protein CWB96_12205 [Pseudoalteromonas citrea]
MWFHQKQSVQEAYRFIKFLTKKKSISDHRIDTEALIQETLLKVIQATKRELSLDTNEVCEDRLSTQNEFNHLLKAYTYRAFESVYLDMSNNVTFRRKSPSELVNSSDDHTSVQLIHIYDSQDSGHANNILDMLPTHQPSPLQGTKIDKNASQFINLLLETIGQEKDLRKQALFFDFFSLSFRQSRQTQKQLGHTHGFQGNAAITHISRFVNKLSQRVKESELDLELHSSNLANLDIYFLNHSNKLNETISV